jgi:hypothetical protein
VTSDVESKVSTAPLPSSSPAVSAIENEIANYRAISPLAIVSLILGLFSVLAFANNYMIAISIAAIATGATAIRKIQRFPDLYTGKVFAQAGIVIALIFGTSAITTLAVGEIFRSSQAKSFAGIFEEALKKGTNEDLLWYSTNPDSRKGKTPKEVSDEMIGAAKDKMMMEQHFAQLLALKRAIDTPGSDIHFNKIEATDDDGRVLLASAVYKLHTTDPKTGKEVEDYALAGMKAIKSDDVYQWWVDTVVYPYKLGTHVKAEAPVDDGHGHGGHH